MNEELQQTIDRLRERGLTDMEISSILSNTGEYGSDSSVINYVVEDYNKKKRQTAGTASPLGDGSLESKLSEIRTPEAASLGSMLSSTRPEQPSEPELESAESIQDRLMREARQKPLSDAGVSAADVNYGMRSAELMDALKATNLQDDELEEYIEVVSKGKDPYEHFRKTASSKQTGLRLQSNSQTVGAAKEMYKIQQERDKVRRQSEADSIREYKSQRGGEVKGNSGMFQPLIDALRFKPSGMPGQYALNLGMADILEDTYRAASDGRKGAQATDEIFDMFQFGNDNISEEQLLAMIETQNVQGESDELLEFQARVLEEGDDMYAYFKALKDSPNPMNLATQFIASSLAMNLNPESLKNAGIVFGSSVAAGTITGSAAGPIGAAVGAVEGIAQGAMMALPVASATTATGMMFMQFVQEELEKRGQEMTKENLRNILEDDALFSKFTNEALTYGASLGVIDGVATAMGVGVLSGGARVAKGMGRAAQRATKAGSRVTALGVESAGGGASELFAQRAIGREATAFEIGTEIFAQGSQGSLNIAIQGLTARAKKAPLVAGSYKINGESVSRDGMLRQVSMTPDGDVSKINFEVKNDASLQDLIEGKKRRHQIRESLPDNLSDSQREALVDLELQKTMMGATDTESAKRKMDDINSKIKEILDGKPEEKAQEDDSPGTPSEPTAPAEEKIDYEQTDKKGRTSTYYKKTETKDGITTTKFTFNRSDKSADQRNPASVPVETALGDKFTLNQESVPENSDPNGSVVVIGVREVRVGESGASADVTFRNVDENGEPIGMPFTGSVLLDPTTATPSSTQEVAPDVEVQVNGEAYKVVTDPETGKVSEVVRVSTNRKAKAGSKNYKAAEAAAKKLAKKKKGKPAKSKKQEVEISEEEALMQEFEAQKDKRSFEVAEPGEVKPSMGVSAEGAKLLNALSTAFGAKVVVHANLESIAATSLPAYQAQKQGKKALGFFRDNEGTVHIHDDGTQKTRDIMVHEFLHAENANNPEFMKSIFDVLQKRASSDTRIADLISKTREMYSGISGYDEAALMDEVVATFGEEAQARDYDSNIFGDIRRLVNSFVDKLPIPDDVKERLRINSNDEVVQYLEGVARAKRGIARPGNKKAVPGSERADDMMALQPHTKFARDRSIFIKNMLDQAKKDGILNDFVISKYTDRIKKFFNSYQKYGKNNHLDALVGLDAQLSSFLTRRYKEEGKRFNPGPRNSPDKLKIADDIQAVRKKREEGKLNEMNVTRDGRVKCDVIGGCYNSKQAQVQRAISETTKPYISPDMTREQKVQAFATAITNDVMSALEHLKESFARGTSLYPDFQTEFPKALDKISDTGAVRKTSEILGLLAAVTSNGVNTTDNVTSVQKIINSIARVGRVTQTVRDGLTGRTAVRRAVESIDLLLEHKFFQGETIQETLYNINTWMNEVKTIGEFSDEMRENPMDPRFAYARDKDENLSALRAFNMSQEVPRSAMMFGPKIGLFAAALNGNGDIIIHDSWIERYRRRIFGEMQTPLSVDEFNNWKAMSGSKYRSNASAVEDLQRTYSRAYGKKKYGAPRTPKEALALKLGQRVFGKIDDAVKKSDRQIMIDAVNIAREALAEKGQDLDAATIGQVLFFSEHALYSEAGVNNPHTSLYSEAAQKKADALDRVKAPDLLKLEEESKADQRQKNNPFEGRKVTGIWYGVSRGGYRKDVVVDIDPTSYYEYMKWHNRMTGNGSVPFDEIHSSDLKYLAAMFQELQPGEKYEPKAGDFQRPEKPSKPFMDKDTMTPKEMKAAVLNFRGIGTERFLTPNQDKLKLEEPVENIGDMQLLFAFDDMHNSTASINDDSKEMTIQDTMERSRLDAEESPLFRFREREEALRIKDGMLSEEVAEVALANDATSVRIMSKNVNLSEGEKVGVRLNLNVRKNTGVPVQTIHRKSATGEALRYAPVVEVKNAKFYVNQSAREKITTFQDNKFPMASVDGDFSSNTMEDIDFDGIRIKFNPFKSNLFTDMSGRPIKSAEKAVVVGDDVFVSGEIEYYDLDAAEVRRGRQRQNVITRENNPKKYEKALNRFIAYSESQGVEFASIEDAEQAYAELSVESTVALNNSEVAARAEAAKDKLKIDDTINGKRRGFVERAVSKVAGNQNVSLRDQIRKNPENYYKPQVLKEIKNNLAGMSNPALISMMKEDALATIRSSDDEYLGVLAGLELINRAIKNGDTAAIPGLYEEMGKIGTFFGQGLRHFAELKSATPVTLYQFVKNLVESKGNSLTENQEKELAGISSRVFDAQKNYLAVEKEVMSNKADESTLEEAVTRLKEAQREMDSFTVRTVERDLGDLLVPLMQGNLIVAKSLAVNISSNYIQMLLGAGVDITSYPIEKVLNLLGMKSEPRKLSILSYMNGTKRDGSATKDSFQDAINGQDPEVTEWRQYRGFAPFRAMMAAMSSDALPLDSNTGKPSVRQRFKLIAEGTLGIPAEIMFRMLSLGDYNVRKYTEEVYLDQLGRGIGLKGEALAKFRKNPGQAVKEKAQERGKKMTFQDDRALSDAAQGMIRGITDFASKFMPRSAAQLLVRTNVPFVKTPTNILDETLQYLSPVYAGMHVLNAVAKGDARSASESSAKAIIGGSATFVASLLIANGLASGNGMDDDESKMRSIMYETLPPNSINASGLKRLLKGEDPAYQPGDIVGTYRAMGLIGQIIGTTAATTTPEDAQKIVENPFSTMQSLRRILGNNQFGVVANIMDQSFLQGLSGLTSVFTETDPNRRDKALDRWMESSWRAVTAIALPNQLSSFHKATREYMPAYSDFEVGEGRMINVIKDRLFLQTDIPPKVDWKGDPIKQTPEGSSPFFYNVFDVTNARQGTSDPVTIEMYRLAMANEGVPPSLVSYPMYIRRRAVDVKRFIPSSRSIKGFSRAYSNLGKDYSFVRDANQGNLKEGFDKVELSPQQINEVMTLVGKARYADVSKIIALPNYANATAIEKIEAINKYVSNNYNSEVEIMDGRFRSHTVAIMDIIQKAYDEYEAEEN